MKTYLGVALVLAALSVASIGPVFASSPSFSLTSSCEEVYYYCGPAVITVQSLNGFSGTVSLTTTITPYCTSCSLTAYMSPSSVTISSGGSATSTLHLGPSCHQTPNCQWDVTITGTSGSTTNSTDVYVCIGRICPV